MAVSGNCLKYIVHSSLKSSKSGSFTTTPCYDQVFISSRCVSPSFHTSFTSDRVFPLTPCAFLHSETNKLLNARTLVCFSKKWSDFEPCYGAKWSRFSLSVSRGWQIGNVERLTALNAFTRVEKSLHYEAWEGGKFQSFMWLSSKFECQGGIRCGNFLWEINR